MRSATFVVALVVVSLAAAARAEDKPSKPIGTWTREIDGRTIGFTITADLLKVKLQQDGATIEVSADYGVTRDGTLFGIVTKVEKTGTDAGPSDGDLFSFRFQAEKDKLTLSDLKTKGDDAGAKQLIEGEYKGGK